MIRSGSAAARAASSSTYSGEWSCIEASIVAWISPEVAVERSWVRRLTTGMCRTSGGKSQSSLTPTSSSPSPSAKTISVADGIRETMRTDQV